MLSSLIDDLSDVIQNVRIITHSIRMARAKNLTAADRTALLAVLEELQVLVRTASGLDRTPAD